MHILLDKPRKEKNGATRRLPQCDYTITARSTPTMRAREAQHRNRHSFASIGSLNFIHTSGNIPA
jgi:hypothetical protein